MGDGTSFDTDQILQLVEAYEFATNGKILIGTGFDNHISLAGDRLIFEGGEGEDIYHYHKGDGSKIITDSSRSTTDTLHLGGFDPSEVTLDIYPHNDRNIVITFAGGSETITVFNAINRGSRNSIDRITFDDGTAWNNATMEAMATVVPGITVSGTSSSQTFESTSANEAFDGGLGRDTYIFEPGFGQDHIDDLDSDIVLNGFSPEDVKIVRYTYQSESVLLYFAGSTDRLIITSLLTDTGSGQTTISFDDGTVWTADQVRQILFDNLSTDGNDYILGLDETSDTLTGGTGAGILIGEDRSDVYIFNRDDQRLWSIWFDCIRE